MSAPPPAPPPPAPQPRAGTPPGHWRIGAIAGIPVFIGPSWLLMAGLVSFLLAPRVQQVEPGIGAGAYVVGLAFAVLVYASILLHEGSHALVAKALGLPVRSITLHFLGGMTHVERESPTPGQEFAVAVVGPITSLAVGGACLAAAVYAPVEGVALLGLQALAGTNLVVGVLNLAPGLPLDGGRVLRAAVWRVTGSPERGLLAAGWGGRVLAVAALGLPFLSSAVTGAPLSVIDVAISAVIAMFLWQGSSAAIQVARVRARLPQVRGRTLARRAALVPADLPLSEAVRRGREASAGGLVTLDADGRPVGVVSEQALRATPEERRPWVPVSETTRTLVDGLLLPADLDGSDLLDAMRRTPATEYVLVEPDGRVYGVLAMTDVEAALTE